MVLSGKRDLEHSPTAIHNWPMLSIIYKIKKNITKQKTFKEEYVEF
jgi:hypothetical protein